MTILTQRWPLGAQFFTDTGAPLAGGTLSYYASGTTNAQAVYSDSAGSSSLGAVVTLNSAGRTTTAVYLGTANDYKESLATSSAAIVITQDAIPKTPVSASAVSAASPIWPQITISTSTVLTTGAPSSTQLLGQLINGNTASGTVALTLPSAVTAVNGYGGIIRKTSASNTLTIATAGGQTINGAASISLTELNEAALIISDGANWTALTTYADGAIAGNQLAATAFSGLTAQAAADVSRTADMIPLYRSTATVGNRKIRPAHLETARFPSQQTANIVVNMTTTAPPGSPTEFDQYVPASGASGAWSGHANDLAMSVDSAWRFVTPVTGYRIFDTATSAYYVWNGTAWVRDLGLTITNFPTTAYGGTLKLKYWSELVTLSGATKDTTAVLPNQSFVVCVAARVVTEITSAAGLKWNIRYAGGSTGTGSAYGNTLAFAAGSTSQGMSGSARYGEAVRIACAQADGSETGSTFTGGTVRVEAWYFEVTPPTS